MDWAKWHDKYKVSPALKERLVIVRNNLLNCFDLLSHGQIKVISICAGDGRDLIGIMENHPRKNDVLALLVENNSDLVEAGRKTVGEAGIENQIKFLLTDATITSNYAEFAPVDIVLLAGVFGNIHFKETSRLIKNICNLCKSGGFVIWTRHRRYNNGVEHIDLIRHCFNENKFTEISLEQTSEGTFTIAVNRYNGDIINFPIEAKLFEFTGYDKL